MTHLTCHRCHLPLSADLAAAESLHRTSEGLIGYVRCPNGHLTVARYDRAVGAPTVDPCRAA